MRHRVSALLVAAGLLAAGCGSGSTSTPAASSTSFSAVELARTRLVSADAARLPASNPIAAGAAVAGFGAALWGELPDEGNLAISPYSLYAALAMTRQGASGEVAAQLDALLRVPDSAAAVTAVDAALAAAQPVDATPDNPAPVIQTANSLWIQDSVIQQPFLDRVTAGFGTGVHLLDYDANPEAARTAINAWVAERTRNLVLELVPEGAITQDTVLTLVNALYFAAEWAVRFTPTQAPLPFTTAAGDTVQAPAFTALKPFATATGDGWRSVTIPYSGGSTAMTLIVPDTGSFDAVQYSLDGDLLTAATTGQLMPLQLTLPSFSVDTALSLRDELKALGATAMFDWSRWPELNPDVDMRILDVAHQAVVHTDEKGTVAAAASAVIVEAESAPPANPPVLTVDRPFLFVIHDTTTKAPLFLGRVLDPTG